MGACKCHKTGDVNIVERKKKDLEGYKIEAVFIPLGAKNLIILKGAKGYIMCGYLNLQAANKFNDVAAKITGVSTIEDAIKARVCSCTRAAKRIGIYKGQRVKETLKIIGRAPIGGRKSKKAYEKTK